VFPQKQDHWDTKHPFLFCPTSANKKVQFYFTNSQLAMTEWYAKHQDHGCFYCTVTLLTQSCNSAYGMCYNANFNSSQATKQLIYWQQKDQTRNIKLIMQDIVSNLSSLQIRILALGYNYTTVLWPFVQDYPVIR